MLDYKIKELKKQIEPRESDINNMKEQIQEVSEHAGPAEKNQPIFDDKKSVFSIAF